MKFDFEKFKEYVKTYDPKRDGCSRDDIIIKDMIYGIGISYDKKYYGFSGYKKFLKYIRVLHTSFRERKLRRILK